MRLGVACPNCGDRMSANMDTRPSKGGVRRRRTCLACGHRFTTREALEGADNAREIALDHRLRNVRRALAGDFDTLEDTDGAH